MATVYVATDLRLERRVALKVMHGHLTDDAVFQSRFIQEARSAARLALARAAQVRVVVAAGGLAPAAARLLLRLQPAGGAADPRVGGGDVHRAGDHPGVGVDQPDRGRVNP